MPFAAKSWFDCILFQIRFRVFDLIFFLIRVSNFVSLWILIYWKGRNFWCDCDAYSFWILYYTTLHSIHSFRVNRYSVVHTVSMYWDALVRLDVNYGNGIVVANVRSLICCHFVPFVLEEMDVSISTIHLSLLVF